MYVCHGGFGGWGRERLVKQQATDVSLWQVWTTTVSAPARCTNQDLISTKHRSRPKGRNDGRIASLSHRTKGGYKNLPLPPHYRKNRWLYKGACFRGVWTHECYFGTHAVSATTKGGYKNLPLPPPTTERTGGYIKERVFGVFGPTSVILGPTLFRRPNKAFGVVRVA